MVFDKPEKATRHTPRAGETLKSIAAGHKLRPEDLATFNWGSSDKGVVTRALIEQIGAPTDRIDHDKPFEVQFDGKEAHRAKGELLIPAVYRGKDFALEKVHTIKVKPPPQAPAVAITELDKWFVPGIKGDGVEGEECVVKYSLSGPETVADKLTFEVHASNYAEATIDDHGVLKFTRIDEPVPVWSEAIAKEKIKRDGSDVQVPGYSGRTNARKGALKPRADDKPKFLNAAFSPYTVVMRFYKDDADKDATIKLEPFYPVFENNTKPAKAESLTIKWKVQKTDKLKVGQLIITAESGKVLHRRALKEADLKKDAEGKFEWDGKLHDGKPILKPGGPYRVQIQAHSEAREEKGVAIAAMHTEVRLFVHPTTGAHKTSADHKLEPWEDKNSLVLNLAPVTVKDLTRSDGARWVAKRLFDLGYHPGPLADALTDKAKKALKEFQRSNPVPDGTTWKRVTADAAENADTKNLLETPTAGTRPIFGTVNDDGTGATDIATLEGAEELLRDPKKKLVVWVADRHAYTESSPLANEPMEMGNYRGPMSIGDERVKKDADSTVRPAIPVEAAVPLLRKTLGLDATDPFKDLGEEQKKKMAAAMAAAVGPLRVDWTFDEIGDAYAHVEDPGPKQIRSRTYLETVVARYGVTLDPSTGNYQEKVPLAADRVATRKYFTNTPAKFGSYRVGIRPDKAGMDKYYKAAFLAEDDDSKLLSLEPWVSIDDSTSRVVSTVVHDDIGQPQEKLHAGRAGRAGIYLHPSRIAGDGYRFHAQVSFDKVKGGTDNPNKDVLKAIYPEPPQAHTAALRNWRKAAWRGYIGWLPAGHKLWNTKRDLTAKEYVGAFVHYVHEGKNGTPTELALADFMTQARMQTTVQAAMSGTPWAGKPVTMTADSVWPWLGEKGWGFAPEAKTAENYVSSVRSQAQTAWRKFRFDLINEVLRGVEKAKGLQRGHLLIEFQDAPNLTVREYKCSLCPRKYSVVQTANQDDFTGQRCTPGGPPACQGVWQFSRDYPRSQGLLLAAVGGKCGASWVFSDDGNQGEIAKVWAHEMGHHRHLEHAPARSADYGDTPPTDKAPGGQPAQHDDAPNPLYMTVGEKSSTWEVDTHYRWSRDCTMSYITGESLYFCGKCLLRNRGWPVEAIDDPDGGMCLVDLKSVATANSVVVTWNTRTGGKLPMSARNADTRLEWGTTAAYGHVEQDATEVSAHRVEITGLTANTEYHFRLTCKAGTEVVKSRDFVVKTASTVPLTISNVRVTRIDTESARITFDTSVPASGSVRYGTTSAYGDEQFSKGNQTHHEIRLHWLTSNTEHHYSVLARDEFGTVTATGADATFRTLA